MTRDSPKKDLVWFNSLSDEAAIHELLHCCGARRWAVHLVTRRPFRTLGELTAKAEEVWWSLMAEDWLEAFRSHPKIGEKKTTRPVSALAQGWSAQEQSGVEAGDDQINEALKRLNNEYEAKFGYIFIVCATGKSSTEILQILRTRLANDPSREIQEAASQQAKITELRLQKLLNE